MNFGFLDLLQLIGALGFFIYGMKVMSDGIQRMAGEKMRQILQAMTSNRAKGVLTGFLITSIIQSSSATTVMVVSFVNAGLLSLVEAIGVIMGANIGTTVTAWLVSLFGFKFDISLFTLPIIAIGFPMMFFNTERIKSLGEFLIGFGLLFMGLGELKDAVPDLRSNPEALAFLNSFMDKGVLSTLFFVFVGTILTVIIQSSSAAMALTLVLVYKDVISFETGAAIVLGENIGTTITANLAALVANAHAKRAAIAHTLFNVFGVVWAVALFPFFLDFIRMIWEPIGQFMVSVNPTIEITSEELQLSLFHSMFNIINTCLLFAFVPQLARVATWVIPSTAETEEFKLEFIGRGLMRTPEISLVEVENEVLKFAKLNVKGVHKISELIEETEAKQQEKLIRRIKEYEEHTDLIEVKVAEFLMELSRSDLSASSSRRVQSFLSVVNHMESIGDVYYQMSRSVEQKIQKKTWFEESHRADLRELQTLVNQAMQLMMANIQKDPKDIKLEEAVILEKTINDLRDKFRAKNFKRIEKGKVSLEAGLIYMDLISGYEKIADNVLHISQALRGDHLDLEDEVTVGPKAPASE